MSALDALKDIKVNLPFVTESKVQAGRIETCRACPEYSHGACLKCGCIMLVKTRLAAEKCPLGKW